MPRPPKFHHPLREIRGAAGNLSQTAFAELVGVSMATVQAIEGGKLRMTPKLAARIAEATGASEAELLKGSAGKAKTVDGQKYTAQSFKAWEGLKQRRSKQTAGGGTENVIRWMQWLMESAQAEGETTLGSVRTLLIETMENVRTKLKLEDAINDRLIPFQQVETYSADVSQWKRVDLPRVQALGYHSSLPLGPKSRLTISLQTLPTWSPGTVPPCPAPTNMDLIPAGYFVVGLGTAGCRMAEAWWRSLCSEHGIDFTTGQAIYGSPTGSWQGFFRKVSQMQGPEKYVPRAIFADLDAESLGAIASQGGDLFHTAAFLFGEQGTGNVFAGADHPAAKEMVESVGNLLQRHSKDVGGVSGIFLMHSLEGGTGGGLAQQLLRKIKAEFPACPMISICPVPDPALGHSVTAPYNLALTLETVSSCASLGLFFDPAVLTDEALKLWKVDIREVEKSPNHLIASALSAFTSPIRFPGGDSQPILLPDWIRQVTGEDSPVNAPFLVPEFRPLQAKVSSKRDIHTAEDLMKSCAGMLKTTRKKPLSQATVLLRARMAEDIWGTSRVLGAAVAERFRITQRRAPQNFENVTVLAGSGDLSTRLAEFAQQAGHLVKRKAYLHWYAALSIDEPQVSSAVAHLERLADHLASKSLA